MSKKLLFVLFIHLSPFVFSQLDYLKMKDTICPNYCGILDSASLSVVYPKLLALDTTQISKGMNEYYYDLSHIQYDLYLQNNEDLTFMKLYLQNTEKSLYHDPKNAGMIWNAAFGYAVFRDCEKTHAYLERYRKVYPKRLWKKEDKQEQIGILLQICPNEELSKKFGIKSKV